jgi:hypothetical protein
VNNGRSDRIEVRSPTLGLVDLFVVILEKGLAIAAGDHLITPVPNVRPERLGQGRFVVTRTSRRVIGRGAKSGDLGPRTGNLISKPLDGVGFDLAMILDSDGGDETPNGILQPIGDPSTLDTKNERRESVVEREKMIDAGKILKRGKDKAIERKVLRERERSNRC